MFILSSEKPLYRGPDTWELVSIEIKKFQHVSIKFSVNANQRVVLFVSNVRTYSRIVSSNYFMISGKPVFIFFNFSVVFIMFGIVGSWR